MVIALSPYRGRSEVLVELTKCQFVPSERLRVGDQRSGMGSNVPVATEAKRNEVSGGGMSSWFMRLDTTESKGGLPPEGVCL